MMLLALVSWWYTTGWANVLSRAGPRSALLLETFSVKLLVRSLFEPFRQISAGQVRGGSFDMQLRALGDKLFSRLFGAVIRSMFIVFGLVAAAGSFVLSLVQAIVWPLVPLLPVIGVVMALMGVRL